MTTFPAAYIFLTSPARFRPLMGGDDILAASLGGVYPPNYGAIGTYRPDASTTGPPPGTVMTPFSGNFSANVAGATYDSIEYFGKVSVTASNVTFKRCIFHGKPANPDGEMVNCVLGGITNTVFDDCIFTPLPGMPSTNGVFGHDFTMRRCEIYNVVDALDPFNSSVKDANSNIYIEQCYFHDFAYYTPDGHSNNQTHNDGIQIQGIHGVTVKGSCIEAYYGSFGSNQISNTANPTPAGWPNPDLTCLLLNTTTTLGTTQLHTIEDNWLLGGFVPCNLGGAGAGVNLGSWKRNKFSGDSWRHSYLGITDPLTIWMRSDQTIDAGEGTADQNTFLDGSPIRIHRNG